MFCHLQNLWDTKAKHNGKWKQNLQLYIRANYFCFNLDWCWSNRNVPSPRQFWGEVTEPSVWSKKEIMNRSDLRSSTWKWSNLNSVIVLFLLALVLGLLSQVFMCFLWKLPFYSPKLFFTIIATNVVALILKRSCGVERKTEGKARVNLSKLEHPISKWYSNSIIPHECLLSFSSKHSLPQLPASLLHFNPPTWRHTEFLAQHEWLTQGLGFCHLWLSWQRCKWSSFVTNWLKAVWRCLAPAQ